MYNPFISVINIVLYIDSDGKKDRWGKTYWFRMILAFHTVCLWCSLIPMYSLIINDKKLPKSYSYTRSLHIFIFSIILFDITTRSSLNPHPRT